MQKIASHFTGIYRYIWVNYNGKIFGGDRRMHRLQVKFYKIPGGGTPVAIKCIEQSTSYAFWALTSANCIREFNSAIAIAAGIDLELITNLLVFFRGPKCPVNNKLPPICFNTFNDIKRMTLFRKFRGFLCRYRLGFNLQKAGIRRSKTLQEDISLSSNGDNKDRVSGSWSSIRCMVMSWILTSAAVSPA